MPYEIATPLLTAGSKLLDAALAGLKAGVLDVDEVQTITRCANRLGRAVAAQGDKRVRLFGHVIADLTPLRDQYGEQLPEIGRVVELVTRGV